MDKIKGSWELLPRLQKILESRSIGVSPIRANNASVGWATRWAVFLAKKALWQDQVSTQTEIVTKCIQHGRWVVFWIPGKNGGKSAMFRFDPSRLLEKWWKNMRDSEEMINIDIKYGIALTGEDIDMDPIHESNNSHSLQMLQRRKSSQPKSTTSSQQTRQRS